MSHTVVVVASVVHTVVVVPACVAEGAYNLGAVLEAVGILADASGAGEHCIVAVLVAGGTYAACLVGASHSLYIKIGC